MMKKINAKWELKVSGSFAAAHRLMGYQGKCRYLHGHNWKVVIGLEVDRLDDVGIGVDFGILKHVLNSVLKQFDHKLLVNGSDTDLLDVVLKGKDSGGLFDIVVLEGNPTAELLSNIIKEKFEDKLRQVGLIFDEMLKSGIIKVTSVEIWESDNAVSVMKF